MHPSARRWSYPSSTWQLFLLLLHPISSFCVWGEQGRGGEEENPSLVALLLFFGCEPPQLTGWGSKHCHLRIPGKQRESVNDLIFLPSVLVHVAWVFLSFAPCVAGHTGSLFSPPERAQSYKW